MEETKSKIPGMREEVAGVDCYNMIKAGVDTNIANQLLAVRLGNDTDEIERLAQAILDQMEIG